ncbi:hypothetical protein Q7P37_005302 [Cladosporium fusiforme]
MSTPSPNAAGVTGQQHEASNVPLPPKRHRPRASLACDTCKTRKTRCDGRQPICHACESRGLSASCTWNYPRRRQLKRNKPEQASVANAPPAPQVPLPPPTQSPSLPSIPATFGRELPQPWSTNSHGVDNAMAHRPPSASAASGFGSSSQSQSSGSFSSNRPPPPKFTLHPPEQGSSDGLATLVGGNDRSLYGPSSTVAFMKNIFPSPSRHTSQSPSSYEQQTQTTATKSEKPERLPDWASGAAMLPRRRNADDFLACYWEFIHPLFPVLHKPSFLKQYQALWASETTPETRDLGNLGLEELVFTATLNLVFGLGCKFSNLVAPAQKNSMADDFYQKSRHLLLFEVLDTTSLSLVQMMCLTGVYLQSTQHANRCWNSVGLAIRVAQTLGLHLNEHGRKKIPQLELEMRRRVWHTCVNLDRLLAMTFGRPTMLSQSWDVPVPALIDDEYLSNVSQGVQPEGKPSVMGLFVSSCSLFDLLEEILNSFYSGEPFPDLSKQEKASEMAKAFIAPVLQYNRRLDKFIDSVPDYLKLADYAEGVKLNNNNSVLLQQQVLYCRFLYVRLLSLRRLLMVTTKRGRRTSTHILSGTAQSSLDEEVIQRCCTLCAETASRLIETLHENLDTLYRSSGWHSVYFTFSAATVLLAACKCPDVAVSVGDPSFEKDWSRCLFILHHYEDQITSATQAIQVLELMKQSVSGNGFSNQQNQAQQQGRSPFQNTTMPPPPTQQQMPPIAATAIPDYNAMANTMPVDLQSVNPFMPGMDSMSEAWFGQQLLNMDWLDPNIPLQHM